MSTPLDTQVLLDAADLVERPGVWARGTLDDGEHVCAHGAVLRQHCTPGDEHLWRLVMRSKGLTEMWNNVDARDAADVATYLRWIAAEVTEADMVEVFGSNWRAIRALARRTAMTTAEGAKVARDAAWAAAWNAAQSAAWNTDRMDAWFAGRDALRLSHNSLGVVSIDASVALTVADLATDDGPLTREHLDTLTRPWCDVTGVTLADLLAEAES